MTTILCQFSLKKQECIEFKDPNRRKEGIYRFSSAPLQSMTRYKQADFEEDDSSSVGSVQLTEGVSATATHIRYHTGTSLWKARSVLEKCLLICLTLLLTIVFIMAAVMSTTPQHEPASQVLQEQYCLSVPCLTAAVSMLNSLNPKEDPCTDFYEYACGGWMKNNPIPDGKSSWNIFGKLEQQNQLVMKNVLEKPFVELKSKAEEKAKLYYLSCLDANETIEALGAKPMLDLLEKFGGWNITGGFNVSSWNLQKTLQTLQNHYNMGGLFSWTVGEDDRHSDNHIIQIDEIALFLPTRDYYLNKTNHEKFLTAYLDYMTKIGVLLGGEEESTRRQMQDVIEFETQLANITSSLEERRDEEKLYHKKSLSEVQKLSPFIQWQEFFADAMKNNKHKVTSKEMVVVYATDYLKKLANIVNSYTATSKGKIVINNYLMWHTVRSLAGYLSKAFRDAYKGLKKVLAGSEGGEEPWRSCVSDTSDVIGFAVGAMFVREAFHGYSKPMAENMINEVRAAFKKNLMHLNWMDPETLLEAEEKADAITDMIGFPDYILIPEQLDEKYKDLEIREFEYFENNVRINMYNLKKTLEKIDQPVNKTRWGMTPPAVNAYYTATKNQIVFPAGILQTPFYDISRPHSLNFGGMGVVMGHELTHAFDDQGREYDKYGNLRQWWKNETISKFQERTDCVVDQYSNYSINNKHINGKQTLGENIADNGGLKAAYHAYLTWAEKNKEELPLPALNLTHKQLFFLSFAQIWCYAGTNEAINRQIENDPHTPSKFRVIGPLSNLPEFSQEFGCALGSPMNPREKCEVW